MRLFIVFLVSLSLLFTALPAQEKEEKIEVKVLKEPPKVTTETPYYKISIEPVEIAFAGQALQSYKNTLLMGYTSIFGGIAISALGLTIKNEAGEPNYTLVWIGGGVTLLGQILNVFAISDLEKSGRHLENAVKYHIRGGEKNEEKPGE